MNKLNPAFYLSEYSSLCPSVLTVKRCHQKAQTWLLTFSSVASSSPFSGACFPSQRGWISMAELRTSAWRSTLEEHRSDYQAQKKYIVIMTLPQLQCKVIDLWWFGITCTIVTVYGHGQAWCACDSNLTSLAAWGEMQITSAFYRWTLALRAL